MSIAAFVLSLMTAIFSFFQGGCAVTCAGIASQSSNQSIAEEAAQIGAGALLMIVASILAITGGIAAFQRLKWSWKVLASAAVVNGFGGFATNYALAQQYANTASKVKSISKINDALVYMVVYGICALLAYRDYRNKIAAENPEALSPSISESLSNFAKSQSVRDFVQTTQQKASDFAQVAQQKASDLVHSQPVNDFIQTVKEKASNLGRSHGDPEIQKKFETLDRLHKLGILTDEEFDKKKAELLSQIK